MPTTTNSRIKPATRAERRRYANIVRMLDATIGRLRKRRRWAP